MTYVEKKYREFYSKHGYIPKYFVPYNCREIKDIHPTLTTQSYQSGGKTGTVLVVTSG